MYDTELKEFEYISQAVGIPVDYTQGGGGNTSVKLDRELMAVKASGFKLKQITPRDGYVVVNYKNLKGYYDNIDLKVERDYEKESSEFVKANIVDMGREVMLRPSVEAGFHSLLKKFVIHTHPVYANILCCSQNGREIVEKIFSGKEYDVAWVPYINPGFCLTVKINQAIQDTLKEGKEFPEVFFMENHGLIVTSNDSQKCVALHQEVNNAIKDYLAIRDAFPAFELHMENDNSIISKTGYIIDFIKNHKVDAAFFEKNALYPDQLVYLNANISLKGMEGKLNINTDTGVVVYKTNMVEAQTMEETLLAYFYVLNGIAKNKLPLKTMTEKEMDFIKNWESEAYRRSLVKEMGK